MFKKSTHTAKRFAFVALAVMAIGFGTLAAENKLVYCVCNPRSKLIELLRSVGARGDFKVMHIPGNWAYCHEHNFTDITAGWYREDAPATYKKANEDIYSELKRQNVFVGENTHTAKDFFEKNPNFLHDPRLQLIFLVSDLHAAIISYYSQKQDYFDKLPATQMTDSIGLRGMYELLKQITTNGGTPPHFIKSEDLFFKPKETMQSLCTFLHIPFKENCLSWHDAGSDFTSFSQLGWYTIELTDCSKKWHGKAIASTGFTKPEVYKVDAKNNPTFEEIINPEHRAICARAYKENLPYYRLLRREKMSKL